jgi:hypothetical protein
LHNISHAATAVRARRSFFGLLDGRNGAIICISEAGTGKMKPGSFVVVYLVNPKERYWGALQDITPAGATLRGLDIASFDDWCRQVAARAEAAIDLTTVFFPIMRIEKIILDEASGGGRSMQQTFERIVGSSVEEYLSL